jgi:sulfite reductase alpha subunit-like flavoprotein
MIQSAWTFLRRADLPSTSLLGVQFTVFGLGDSSYSRFNVASKMFEARLLQLGASKMIPRGDGDDQHRLGLYGGFLPWLDSLTFYLNSLFPLPSGDDIIYDSNTIPEPRYKIHLVPTEPSLSGPVENSSTQSNPFQSSFDEHHPYTSHLLENERITAAEWTQDVRHVALDSRGLIWKPGDVVYIRPVNFPDDISKLLRLFNVSGDEKLVSIERLDLEAPNIRCEPGETLRSFVASELDISGVPRRYFFELLSHFATNELQALKLNQLASAEGQEELHDYARRAKRSFLDVMDDFDSARPPLNYLLDLFPKLQPRAFSISSSHSCNPNQLTISMVVVRYRSQTNRLRRGVCSTWISQILPQPPSVNQSWMSTEIPIPIWIKPGTMRLPQDLSTPLILVGPGTGCAIFRAFIQERIHIIKQGNMDGNATKLGPAIFYFGCRHEAQDFLYSSLWMEALGIGAISQLSIAFSQDRSAKRFVLLPSASSSFDISQNGNAIVSETSYTIPALVSKTYVQLCIKEDANQVFDLVHRQMGSIFVCGNANKMPTDVRNAFITSFMQAGGMTDTDAETYVRNLEAKRRYCVESWS